ncbi:unnamed protein product [Polarella glacialis]|uniref:Uncharacterized protein n=1 Tax=Polarella glacialis TaxID=89957 RepID=A0A813D4A0_POLGL|nr:unnamed protein product [Polarella glacialis]
MQPVKVTHTIFPGTAPQGSGYDSLTSFAPRPPAGMAPSAGGGSSRRFVVGGKLVREVAPPPPNPLVVQSQGGQELSEGQPFCGAVSRPYPGGEQEPAPYAAHRDRRPSLAGYPVATGVKGPSARRPSVCDIAAAMIPKSVHGIRSQVMVSRTTDNSHELDSQRAVIARGRRPSVVEATFYGKVPA